MTVYSQPITDIAGAGDQSRFWFYREDNLSPSADESEIITGSWVDVQPVAGVLTTPPLKPGPAKVSWGGKAYDLVIPDVPDDEPIPLWPDIQNYVPQPGPVVSAAVAAKEAAEAARDAAQEILADVESGVVPDSGVAARVAEEGSATRTAVDARVEAVGNGIYAPVDATGSTNRVVIIGPSLEEQNGQGAIALDPDFSVPSKTAMRARGWFTWCNGFLGNILNLAKNSGVGGNKFFEMRARFATDVLAYDPDVVIIGSPTNDVGADRALADILADLEWMIEQCRAVGAVVIVLNIPPRITFTSAARRLTVAEYNRYVAALSATRKGVLGVDTWRCLADPLSGFPVPATTVDGTHYSIAGAAILGKSIADQIRHLFTNKPGQTSFSVDPRRFMDNPALLSNGSGWTALAGSTVTYTQEVGGYGNEATATFSGNASATAVFGLTRTVDIASGLFFVADVIQATARVKWSSMVALAGDIQCQPVLMLEQLTSGGSVIKTARALWSNSTEWATWPSGNTVVQPTPTAGDMVLSTWQSTIASNCTQVRLTIGWMGAASATVKISELSPLKDSASTIAHPSPAPANTLPTPVITETITNLTASVSGTSSTDGDGSIVAYAWNFGDGTTASGATASHTYATAGSKTVTLTVTDNAGGTNSTSKSITVTDPPAVTRDDPGVSGYSFRWVADEVTAADGTAVASLADWESGKNLANATLASQPTVQTVAGERVIRFDGTDDFLSVTGLTAWGSCVVIGRYVSDAPDAVAGIFSATDGKPGLQRGTSATSYRGTVVWTGARSVTAPSGVTLPNGTWFCFAMRNTNGDARYEQNGSAVTLATADAVETATTFQIGRRNTAYGKVEIAEVILYPGQLTDAHMASIYAAARANHPALLP
ncbi:PKD domain-containing protein [Rhodococcus sp. USK13]|uniref:PKD domain-containing protein n=1 Tax=Rhodococcus sp. USK13 TaxID=2806442 RepID=UPI001BCD6FF6|nr:PKD domain-containing protein [Rhodococcus sp. USK13]